MAARFGILRGGDSDCNNFEFVGLQDKVGGFELEPLAGVISCSVGVGNGFGGKKGSSTPFDWERKVGVVGESDSGCSGGIGSEDCFENGWASRESGFARVSG